MDSQERSNQRRAVHPQADILNQKPNEMVGRDAFEFVHPEDRVLTHAKFPSVPTRSDPEIPFPYRFRHSNGHKIEVKLLANNLLDDPGVNGILMTTRDITERKNTETEKLALQSQLIQAQKMEAVGQLAGGVAHDFNNILTAMLMQLNLLEEDKNLSLEMRTGLKELESYARRAADLTRQLLMFSRHQVMQKRSIDLNSLLGSVLKMLRRVIGEQISIQFNAASSDLWLEADAGMIEQIVMNLVVNARDAMSGGGRVTLTTRLMVFDEQVAQRNPEAYPGQFVCLAVSDTGSGMDEVTIKHIFEPFFTTKETGKGTGLGLATVFGIVKQHQGWIEVESSIGHGSTFKIYLPSQAKVSGISNQQTTATPGRGGDETVLVAEDEISVRHGVVAVLKRLGYQVREASNGPEALRAWEELNGQVDLLISDVVMPEGMSGLELTELLLQKKPALKVILMSGYTAEKVQHSLPPKKGLMVLQKPFELSVLSRTVRDCLDQK